jgi:hypothetical protein
MTAADHPTQDVNPLAHDRVAVACAHSHGRGGAGESVPVERS